MRSKSKFITDSSMNNPSERRANLGDFNFSKLNHEHVRYYEFNTVLALWLTVATCLVYLVAINTFVAEFITVLMTA